MRQSRRRSSSGVVTGRADLTRTGPAGPQRTARAVPSSPHCPCVPQVPGKLYISERQLRFLSCGGLLVDPASAGAEDKEKAAREQRDSAAGVWAASWVGAIARDAAIAWPLSSVKQMHRRRYLFEHSALELFDDA